MNVHERLLIGVVPAVLVALGTWLGVRYYGHEQYDTGYSAGYAAAMVTCNAQRDLDTVTHQANEAGLRARLADCEDYAHLKKQSQRTNLKFDQHRKRSVFDRFR